MPKAVGVTVKGNVINVGDTNPLILKIIADINSKAQAELAEVRDKIKNEAEVAREALQKEVDKFANQICQKILGRAV